MNKNEKKTGQTRNRTAPTPAAVTLAKRYAPPIAQPGVRYVAVTIPAVPQREPRSVGVDPETVQRLAVRKRPQPRRMLVEDDDPAFASRLAQQIRQIEDAVARIAYLTSARTPPPGVEALRRDIRVALGEYLAQLPARSGR